MSSPTTRTTWAPPAVYTTQTAEQWQPSQFIANPVNGMDYEVWFTLDTVTGELKAKPDTVSTAVWRSASGARDPNLMWTPDGSWDWAPRLITWCGPGRALDTTVVHDVIAWMLPRAQLLIESLQPLPETPGWWDWTVTAAAFYNAIARITSEPSILSLGGPDTEWETVPPASSKAEIISFADAVEVNPALINPLWGEMDDDQLSTQASGIARNIYAARPAWGAVLTSGPPKSVVGALAGLHQWRAEVNDRNRPTPVAASRWIIEDFSRLGGAVTADTNDIELEKAAVALNSRAYDEGVRLVGTRAALADHRAGLRVQVRRRLEHTGQKTNAAEARAARLREQRAAYLAQVLCWKDPQDCDPTGSISYVKIARIAGMTRQAVQQHANRIAEASK